MTPHEYAKADHAIERKFGQRFNTIIRESAGIESEGLRGVIKGTAHRFATLGLYTKVQIIFGTVFSTAATVGGFTLINQNTDLR